MGIPKTADGKPYVTIWPTEGSRVTVVSHNWCDPTTWYTSAIREVEQECIDSGDHLTYNVESGPIIVDAFHGKISNEDELKDADGNSYRVTVTVNDTPVTEIDPHTLVGDFTVNYLDGKITFATARAPSDVVLITYHLVTNSIWKIAPNPGTILKITNVEAQFSTDVEVNDTILFQARGLVDVFAPHLVAPGGPIPSGTIIPLGSPLRYKTLMDFINEANGNYPIIPAMGTNWRGIPQPIVTFPWDYAAMTSLPSATKMEIEIRLEHDTPFGGAVATAAFYCLSEVETT